MAHSSHEEVDGDCWAGLMRARAEIMRRGVREHPPGGQSARAVTPILEAG
jgi:hypothetical protein